ncbi:flagellar M-ring protein FliF [Oceanicola sp. 22II-s10i]|uniref:flagellar basal-body MS-ring/collar protein FliF n=1 Tax=Oceanicola sp. 22II-s10i TaxID=1317116 RepID=UPI000B522B9D|nr:flagellar basal-body MS-ring/collar protein FliF [Oceanicola sp. 22II-s10i]OWU83202.1 flagellar M-ring protein FliF [Oceanicola sp. 22II-s10i]
MQALLDNLRALGWRRLSVLGGTGAMLLAALFFGLSFAVAPEYTPVYRDLSPGEASRVVESLEQAGFRVQTDSSGSMVSVPRDDIARARMELAGLGLPNDGTPGWELFDEQSGIGMNTFMQRVNRLRALEGELARSIQTIDGVDAARVHLVLPEREPFSRERPRPSASVIVRGRGSRSISTRQGQSIRALVAAAVPDLAPTMVTVLSASGETILGEEGEIGSEANLQTVRSGIEDRLRQRITEILTARVGAGNARVQVTVDLSSERQVLRQQSYDPAQRVVRSTETREETRDDSKAARGEVGVADDIPAALADGGGATNRNTSSMTNEIVNYEIGGSQSETVREPGEVEKVSVAVLVNGIYNVQPDGTVDYAERPADELQQLQALVQTAVGFDQQRGDNVSVVSLRFMDYSMDVGEPVTRSITQILADNLNNILRGLFALVLVAIVLFLGFRPALRQALAIQRPDDTEALPGASAATAALPATGAEGEEPGQAQQARPQLVGGTAQSMHHTGTILDPLPPGADDELVRIATVQGGVQRGWISTINELIEREPDDALKVVKGWLAEGA